VEQGFKEENPGLTRRELEVLQAVLEHDTAQKAADELCIGKRTVDFHLGNIYDKLQVVNFVQALRRAAQLGLVSFP